MLSNPSDISVSTSTLLKIVGFVLALFFLWAIRDILIVLLIAVTFASALEPMVDALNERKIPRAVSVLSVYIIAIGLIGLIAYIIFPPVLQEFSQLSAGTDIASAIQAKLGASHFVQSVHLDQLLIQNTKTLSEEIAKLSANFFQTTLGFFNGVVEIVTILVVSFYLLAEKNGMKNFVYTLVPDQYQNNVLHVVKKVQRKVGFWLVGQLILSAIIFSVVLIVLSIFGIKFALALAMLAGFFEIVPYIGPIISAIPAVFFAFLQSPTLAIIILVTFIGIQKLEGYVLVPKVMEKTTGLSPLVILVAILIGFKLAGIFGILLAVPIVSALNVIYEEWRASSRSAA